MYIIRIILKSRIKRFFGFVANVDVKCIHKTLKYYYILALTKFNYQLEGIIRIKRRFANYNNTYSAQRRI